MACMTYASMRSGALLLVLALTTSACQTIDNSPVVNTWQPAPIRTDNVLGRVRTTASTFLAERPAASPTFVEGSGRFVGAPAPATQTVAADASGEGGDAQPRQYPGALAGC